MKRAIRQTTTDAGSIRLLRKTMRAVQRMVCRNVCTKYAARLHGQGLPRAYNYMHVLECRNMEQTLKATAVKVRRGGK